MRFESWGRAPSRVSAIEINFLAFEQGRVSEKVAPSGSIAGHRSEKALSFGTT
jgi:hypothetical protein